MGRRRGYKGNGESHLAIRVAVSRPPDNVRFFFTLRIAWYLVYLSYRYYDLFNRPNHDNLDFVHDVCYLLSLSFLVEKEYHLVSNKERPCSRLQLRYCIFISSFMQRILWGGVLAYLSMFASKFDLDQFDQSFCFLAVFLNVIAVPAIGVAQFRCFFAYTENKNNIDRSLDNVHVGTVMLIAMTVFDIMSHIADHDKVLGEEVPKHFDGLVLYSAMVVGCLMTRNAYCEELRINAESRLGATISLGGRH